MEIGIIGAGFIGGTLGRKLAAAGHTVRIANSKDPSTLSQFDGVAGIHPAWATDAIAGADMAILSIPEKAVATLPTALLAALATVPIVIDTGNYYPVRDGRIEALDRGMADSEWVASRIGCPVYKAFNNIPAPSLKSRGTDDPARRIGLTVAGPAGEGKRKVVSLIEAIGFDPVDAGDLSESWRLQPGTPTYCRNMTAEQIRSGLVQTSADDLDAYHESRDALKDFDAAAASMAERM
jgi:predicted dinucleotide-binding enzyme